MNFVNRSINSLRFIVKTLRCSTDHILNSNRFCATKVFDAEQFEGTVQFNRRRACLYVPGDDEQKIIKSVSFEADCLILDCEDGVSASKKAEARNCILKQIQSIDFKKSEVAVRINKPQSEEATEDLNTIMNAEKLPTTIFLPKVETIQDIDWFAETLGKCIQKKDVNINLLVYIESARALLDIKEICNRAVELSEFNFFHLDGIIFGSDDFCASIGATRTSAGSESMLARQTVLVSAKAFNLQAIDSAYIDYQDLKGLEKDASEGAKLGFTGKQAIHPSQVPIIQRIFTPSIEKIEWAKELLRLYNEHEKSGKGVLVFKGQSIDKPLVRQARNILKTANIETETKTETKNKEKE